MGSTALTGKSIVERKGASGCEKKGSANFLCDQIGKYQEEQLRANSRGVDLGPDYHDAYCTHDYAELVLLHNCMGWLRPSKKNTWVQVDSLDCGYRRALPGWMREVAGHQLEGVVAPGPPLPRGHGNPPHPPPQHPLPDSSLIVWPPIQRPGHQTRSYLSPPWKFFWCKTPQLVAAANQASRVGGKNGRNQNRRAQGVRAKFLRCQLGEYETESQLTTGG